MACIENDFSSIVVFSLLTAVVGFQVIGLGLYQAGTLHLKSTNTILIQALLNMALGSILWYSVGYSLVFGTSQKGFIGSPAMAFFIDVPVNCSTHAHNSIMVATFEMLLAVCAPFIVIAPWTQFLSTIGAICVFVIWPIVVYYPLSHWIRGGGWLQQLSIIDYAGSLTVHTSSGIAGLILTRVLRPHLKAQIGTMTSHHHGDAIHHVIFIIGALVTAFSWFVFNLGSAGMTSSSAGLAVVNTYLSSSASCLCYVLVFALGSKQCLYSDMVTGIIAGAIGVSSAPVSIHAWAALVIGILVGMTSSLVQFCVRKYAPLWTNGSKVDLSYTHGISGILGALAAGLFTDPSLDIQGRRGGFYSNGKQFGVQVLGVTIVLAWSAVLTYLITWFIHLTVGFNITRIAAKSIVGGTPSHGRHTDYRSKLLTAAINGQLKDLQELAAKHVNFNMKDFDYQTALLLASSHGHIQCVKFILRQPTVDIHAKDRWGSTALTEAIRYGHDRIVQCLIRHGCSWTQDGAGDILCAAVGKNDMEEIARLVSMGMDVNAANSNGSYAIHLAAKLGSRVLVQYLIDQRADINTVDSSGNTPLNYSDMHEHRAVSQLLEGLGARRVSRHYSIQEICEVATTGNLQMLRHMVHNGASVCYRDVNHRTPLHVGASEGHLDVVKFLVLQPGIDVNAEDKNHFTALLDSIVNNHHDVAEFLKSHGATVNEYRLALLMTEMARTGDIKNLKRILRLTGHVDTFDFDGNTALHIASSNGRVDVAGMLLKEGADACLMNRFNETPLELASSYQHLLVEKELRKHLKVTSHLQDKVENDDSSTSCYQRPTKIPRRNYKTKPSTYHYQPRDSWSSTDISLEPRKNTDQKTRNLDNHENTHNAPSFLRVMPVSQLSAQTRELTGGKPDYV